MSSPRAWSLVRSLVRPCHRCMSVRAMLNKNKESKDRAYVLLVVPAAAFGLGCWQVQRRKWKLGLVYDLENRTRATPIPLPHDLSELKELEYRKVEVRGTFDHSREIFMGPRTLLEAEDAYHGMGDRTQSGMHVVTPFTLDDRDVTILVSRGWVPRERMKPTTRPAGQVQGVVPITGMVRLNENRPQFAPKQKGTLTAPWMYRDLYTMSSLLGTEPVFIDADSKSTVEGGPIGGQTRVTLRNEHMQYIITWFSLAALTMVMWYRKYWRPPPVDSIAEYLKRQQK